MRSKDVKLVETVKRNVDRILEQQKQQGASNSSAAGGLIEELHGPLVELIDIDGEDNTTFIDFLIALIYARKNRTNEEAITLLEDLSHALAELRVNNQAGNYSDSR